MSRFSQTAKMEKERSVGPYVSTLNNDSKPVFSQGGLLRLTNQHHYRAYLTRGIVLVAAFVVAQMFHQLSAGRPYFSLLTLLGIIALCAAVVLSPQRQVRAIRLLIPVFDVAWMMFAMHVALTVDGFWLPVLYMVVALATIRGERWEVGLSMAAAITGLFIIAAVYYSGSNILLATGQATLLTAGALATRLLVSQPAAEVERNATEELYGALLEATSDAVITLAPETWRVWDTNATARELFAETQAGEDLLNIPLSDLFDSPDKNELQQVLSQVATGLAIINMAVSVKTVDGQAIPLRLTLTPAFSDGSICFVQALLRNEETGIGLQDDRETALRYMPVLAHEINNQLAAMRMNLEMAHLTGEPPKYPELLQQVETSRNVLKTVLTHVRTLTSPEDADGEQEKYTDPRTAIEGALLLGRPQLLVNNIALSVSLPDELPPVGGRREDLQEALVRVILHCAETMAGNDPPRSLLVSAMQTSGGIEILMQDTGPGLSLAETAYINSFQGSCGMGTRRRLWNAVRYRLRACGGVLHATNGLNGGTRYSFHIPTFDSLQEGEVWNYDNHN